MASGRDAEVFVLDDKRVLRRCRNGEYRCEGQAALMEWARAQGFPVPRVYSACGPEMVLERVDGPTMVEAMSAGSLDPVTIGRLLADLLRALHALPVPARPVPLRRGSTSCTRIDLARSVTPATSRTNLILAGPAGWPDGHRLRHLDLHPENVLMSSQGPMVIDWSNADNGPAGVDTALSALILAQIAILPGPFQDPVRPMICALLNGCDPFSDQDVDAAVAMRAVNPTMTEAEIAALGRASELIRPAG